MCEECIIGIWHEYYDDNRLISFKELDELYKGTVYNLTIVRHYLEKYPDYKQRLENIDTFLQDDEIYKVYRYVEQQKKK